MSDRFTHRARRRRSGGHVAREEAEALVLIGRSMLDVDEDAVEALAAGLQERVAGALAA